MKPFRFSKIDHFRQSSSKNQDDLVDLKFPSEISTERQKNQKNDDLLIFVVDDDPVFMQIVNTHLSKLKLDANGGTHQIKVRNYATGRSCLKDLSLKPDIVFLNYAINKGLPNALKGKEILDKIIEENPNQKVAILNNLTTDIRHAFTENGLRDYIINDPTAVEELNDVIREIVEKS